MIGLKEIGTYIPAGLIDNSGRFEEFGTTSEFIENKIGISSLSRKGEDESVADMCVAAFENLLETVDIDREAVDCVIVCTQNSDRRIPHTSSVVQDVLGIGKDCAVFDISLGCSGYVYSLSLAKSFMESNGLKNGLVFTCDPYSRVLNHKDKNTELLFGDAATVSLLTDDPAFEIGRAVFFNDGSTAEALLAEHGGLLSMDGRGVFNFVLRYVPGNILKCLDKNNLAVEDIDMFALHQASKYVLDNLVRRMKLDPNKVPFAMRNYGNTVSSSIPLVLNEYLEDQSEKLLLSGFGVGLGVASVVLRRC